MKANSYAEIGDTAERGIRIAAERLGANVNDVRGYYVAGGEWEAETAEQLAELIVACWNESPLVE